jgi:O-antigen ligase
MTFNISYFYLLSLIVITPWASFLAKHSNGLNQLLYTMLVFGIGSFLLYRGVYVKNLFIKLFFFLILYIFVINLILIDDLIEIIKLPLIVLLSIFSLLISRYLTLNNLLNDRKLFLFSIYTISVLALFIFIDKANGIQYYDLRNGIVSSGIAGNISKYAAILFPIFAIFIYLNKYLFAFIQFILIVITQRRSALLGEIIFLTISIIPNLFNIFVIKQNMKKIISSLILILLISFLFIDQISNLFLSVFNRLDDISEGSAGGRKIFWALAFDFYLSFDTANLFFGNPGALPQYLDQRFGLAIGAHSDILDFLCNYGAIGLLLYLSIYFFIFKYFWNCRFYAKKESITGIALIIAMFFLSITTGGFFYSLNLMYFIFTGYLVAITELKKENKYE